MTHLKIGDMAPEFELEAWSGVKEKSRTSLREILQKEKKNVVLYFYPKDDTPGCTTEACAFRDSIQRFASNDTVILGVSLDDIESHKKFADKYNLPFTLLSDSPNKSAAKAYGVLTSMQGIEVAERTTFLIGRDGRIKEIFEIWKPSFDIKDREKHVQQIKNHPGEILQSLGSGQTTP